ALQSLRPDIRIMGAGEAVEIYKEVGLPEAVVQRFKVSEMKGSHGIGHTRMATESAVTTMGAHPFSTGPDQCLVHNGSLSNHNNLRRELIREGMRFETENDTEVAAAYLTASMAHGKNLEEALEREAGTRQQRVKVLGVKEVGRKENHFLPAVMLIYLSKRTQEVRVRFAVDGRLSTEHEKAFLTAGGIEKLGIRDSVVQSDQRPELPALIGTELAAEASRHLSSSDDGSKLKLRASIARFRAEVSRQERPVNPAMADAGGNAYAAAIAEAERAERELATLKVRPIAVYEHPPLLQQALDTAQTRLLIISPWITPAVVDQHFVRRLRAALERGVKVRIGYGLHSHRQARPKPNDAEKALSEISTRNSALEFVWLGNTHAKILLKDSEWFVVSSFNWLSFRGDPGRTFREEWGMFVGVSSVVDKYHDELLARFNQGKVVGKPQTGAAPQ
ncbi:MAG: hypothetical protein J0H19_25845, partial [Rhodospirillales bacterium]|nr:hypothetical protein [Rhodospirillales bacterium]